jgi:hypothetical protein
MHIHAHPQEIIIMSSRKLQSFARFLAIGAAALIVQTGGVAAAGQPDIQTQMQEVLSGRIGANLTSHASTARDAVSAADSQGFARRLLQGWSVSSVAGARPAKEQVAANSTRYQDLQAMVRRQLLGT